MLIQAIRQGIPLDELGMPLKTTGSVHLQLFNDAQAAISISNMEGLLRRVRRVELRARYIQSLCKRGRLSLTHWAGTENPSHGLTKSCKTLSMWVNLCQAVGLVPGLRAEDSQWIQYTLRRFDEDFAHLYWTRREKGPSGKQNGESGSGH